MTVVGYPLFCMYIFLAHSRCLIQSSQGLPGVGGAGWSISRSGQRPKALSASFLGCRGLRFIQVFLQSICDGERDENHPNLIRVNATKAYEMALKKYHGWIVQKIFQVNWGSPVLSPGPGDHQLVWSTPCPATV